jgi:hypothetical protein
MSNLTRDEQERTHALVREIRQLVVCNRDYKKGDGTAAYAALIAVATEIIQYSYHAPPSFTIVTDVGTDQGNISVDFKILTDQRPN